LGTVAEFDRQVDTLVAKGYPKLTGVTRDAFVRELEALRERVDDRPFVIALRNSVPREKAIELVELHDRPGFTSMEPDDLARFDPIERVELPNAFAYLVVDVDTGRETLNVTPDDALESIARDGRSPLTIEEGLALVTHHPEVLRSQNAFSILGSRCGDRRVTAVWVSGGRPRLGWCWAGNPHTWLGSGSCAERVS
jgi:Family of unknown function (DUF5701)